MSADNGIYIHKFRNGWAVVHAQAIENIYNIHGGYNQDMLKRYFKGAQRFPTEHDAFAEANRMYKEIMKDNFSPICEYGIRIV